ncbi:lipopolysaccharide heptosyltransferase I [Sporomusaceae bacterium BoRhaA]|uniref:glycosyltransferase family 9 protein n=1 Tax=Pelorhabdus rhamnosifermentans TaxID=2772457 RepID=UPI001C061AA3|nr:glycosyltransferase family 9 protein [Pelorhabdus rhamnosifermentans]MBU2704107.1 lipopolysaccharide heptosyltransferase I [Pelorhabdus rhamnosifermentans]
MPSNSFNTDKIHRILVIKLSSIGDVIQSSPVADKLRKRYPNAIIDWIVETKSKDVIIGNSNLDEVIVWKRKEWVEELKKTWDYCLFFQRIATIFKHLRQRNYDLAIDLQGLFRSALVAWLSGALWRVCYTDTGEFSPLFANIKIQPNYERDIHVKYRYVGLLQFLGIDTTNLRMQMPLSSSDREFANNFLTQNSLTSKQYIVLNPATSWQSKCWPADFYAHVGDLIISRLQLPIVILGAPNDQSLVKEIKDKMGKSAFDLAGQTTLKELATVIEQAALFIGGDTGPLYIAEAIGTATVSIFGPTDPAKHAPIGSQHIALAAQNCKFCYKGFCADKRCMLEITPEQVYDAVTQLLPNKYANEK